MFKRETGITSVGILPVMVNNRLQMTQTVLNALEEMSAELRVPLMPLIRTDTTVVKAARSRQFLQDYDPKSKALEDYETAADVLLKLFKIGITDVPATKQAPA